MPALWLLALLTWTGSTAALPRNFPQYRQAPVSARPADGQVVKRGEALFTRHCPICHLGRPSEARPYVGRNLRGILKNAKPARETEVREAIRKGNDRMPGYQYALTPAQVDDLIAYLKTYN